MSNERAASGSTSLDLGPRDETWDAGAAKKALDPSDYPKAAFWRDPQGDPKTLAAYKLWFADPSGGLHAVWAGVTAVAAVLQGGRGGVNIPEGDVAGVKRKVEAYYAKARDKYGDDSIEAPWASAASAALRYAVAPITHVDVRDPYATSDNTWTMSGYAAVFNQETTLFDSNFLRATESIAPTFFDRTLREQDLGQPSGVVHFNFGHDMNRAVASTYVPAGQPGSLQLSSDAHGLRFLARVPKDDPDAVAMAVKMRSGVVRQASFAFTIARDEYVFTETDDGPATEHRTLLECKHLYDVCATPQGAYWQTVSSLRSLAAALGQPEISGGLPLQPTSGGASPASRENGGGAEPVNAPELEAFSRRTASIRELLATRYKPREVGNG